MVTPQVYINEFLENAGFKITTLDLDLTSDGWLRVHARWTAEEEWKTKYPQENGWISGGNTEGAQQNIRFAFGDYGKENEYSYNAQFELGILDKKNVFGYRWNFKFTENIKYGVNIYFAPEGWNCGPDIRITSFNSSTDTEIQIHKNL